MRSVLEFPIAIVAKQIIVMPAGARVIALDVKNDRPFMWALIDPSAPVVERTFVTFATGQQFDEREIACNYRGTYVLRDGTVGHVVELA